MENKTYSSIIKRIFLVILMALCLSVILFCAYFLTGYKVYRDLSYGETEHNVMDVYLPDDAGGQEECGVVLFIHGGSWSGGDKSEEDIRCRMVARQGYISATLNYTLRTAENADDYTVFWVLDEIDAALLKIKDFATEKGIKVSKVAISGYSAGAHLALLYTYSRGDTASLEIVFTSSMAGPADISADVWGADMAARIGTLLTGEKITAEDAYSGAASELLSTISPISYVNEGVPPTIIIHGGRDTTVPEANAESLIERLSSCSIPHEYVYLENSDHLLLQNPIKHLSYYRLLIEYCDIYFN